MPERLDLIPVLAAVIQRNNCVLLARRPLGKRHGRLWEFPGGKLAADEDHLAAAKRELAEELGLQVESVGAILFERKDPGSEFLIQFIGVDALGEPQALRLPGSPLQTCHGTTSPQLIGPSPCTS